MTHQTMAARVRRRFAVLMAMAVLTAACGDPGSSEEGPPPDGPSPTGAETASGSTPTPEGATGEVSEVDVEFVALLDGLRVEDAVGSDQGIIVMGPFDEASQSRSVARIDPDGTVVTPESPPDTGLIVTLFRTDAGVFVYEEGAYAPVDPETLTLGPSVTVHDGMGCFGGGIPHIDGTAFFSFDMQVFVVDTATGDVRSVDFESNLPQEWLSAFSDCVLADVTPVPGGFIASFEPPTDMETGEPVTQPDGTALPVFAFAVDLGTLAVGEPVEVPGVVRWTASGPVISAEDGPLAVDPATLSTGPTDPDDALSTHGVEHDGMFFGISGGGEGEPEVVQVDLETGHVVARGPIPTGDYSALGDVAHSTFLVGDEVMVLAYSSDTFGEEATAGAALLRVAR